ncbi:MAG: hypothetical protein M5U15_12760 [Kiritimatiellae bacterium]|nr:hypothetical protein [Kiritimatiellia bacterium]
MADIAFTCPGCENSLVIDASAAGFFINCPHCNTHVQIPHESGAVASVVDVPAPVGAGSDQYRFRCPECRGKLRMRRGDAGQPATCPHCKKHFTMPEIPPDAPAVLPSESESSAPAAPEKREQRDEKSSTLEISRTAGRSPAAQSATPMAESKPVEKPAPKTAEEPVEKKFAPGATSSADPHALRKEVLRLRAELEEAGKAARRGEEVERLVAEKLVLETKRDELQAALNDAQSELVALRAKVSPIDLAHLTAPSSGVEPPPRFTDADVAFLVASQPVSLTSAPAPITDEEKNALAARVKELEAEQQKLREEQTARAAEVKQLQEQLAAARESAQHAEKQGKKGRKKEDAELAELRTEVATLREAAKQSEQVEPLRKEKDAAESARASLEAEL